MGLSGKNFGLFMTRGMSLGKWAQIGTLEREIKPYNNLAKSFNTIYIFSYGLDDSQIFSAKLVENVKVVDRSRYVPVLLYSFLIPFIHRKILKNIDIFKTNQMDGSWAAVLAKKLYKKFLVVRCGYEWLYTIQKKQGSAIKQAIARAVERFAYTNADQIILTSDASKDFVIKNFKINIEKIQIIPNYIDTELFKPLGLEKDKKRILFIGRLEKDKNPTNLVLACAETDLKIVFVGEGSQKSELQELASKNKVDIVGENGILSDNDPKSLRYSILKVVQDESLCRSLGANARIQIEKENALQVCLEKESKLYQSL